MKAIRGDAREFPLDHFEQYRTIVADPPWTYADRRKFRSDGYRAKKGIRTCGIGASLHYQMMTTAELCDIPVEVIAAERCHLYLWATCPLLPDAFAVMDAWGFNYSTIAFVWVKVYAGRWDAAREKVLQAPLEIGDYDGLSDKFMNALNVFGPGFYTESNVEIVLLGTRGKPFRHGPKMSQVVYSPPGHHSAKPDEVQKRIETMYPDATPRLELFARRPRPGWTVFGNEV